MSTTTTDPEIVFTGLNKRGSIPQWANKHDVSCSEFPKAVKYASEHEIIVVRELSVNAFVSSKKRIRAWITANEVNANLAHYVICVDRPAKDKRHSITQLLEVFPRSFVDHMDIALGSSSLENTVWEAFAKQNRRHSDPLSESHSINKITETLRTESGRLSAKKIADTLDISVAELAAQLGSTRQAVSKTPDAKTLQLKLRPYERIIRLRSVLSQTKFKNWLNHTFPDLDGMSPLELITSGNADVVADFADDALLGTPA